MMRIKLGTIASLWWIGWSAWGAPDTGAALSPSPATAPTTAPASPSAASAPIRLTLTNTVGRMLAAAPDRQAEVWSALMDIQQRRYEAAIGKLEAIIQRNPGQVSAWEGLGWAYYLAGRQDDAIALWKRLQNLDPKLPQPYYLLGQVYAARNDLTAASALFEQHRSQGEPLPEEQFNYARVLRWNGRMEQASALLRPLIKADPDRLDIMRELANALLEDKEFEEALPLWQKLLAADPTNLLFKARAAVALLHTGHTVEGVAQARTVLAAQGAQPDAVSVLADYEQYIGGRPEAALPWLLQMISGTPKPARHRQLTLRYANLCARLNSMAPDRFPSRALALPLLQQLVEKDPYDVDMRLTLAEVLNLCQLYDAAREQSLWVLNNLHPNNFRARRNLFEVALAQGRLGEARQHYDKLAAFNPRDPYRHYYLARLYAEQGSFPQAFKELDQLEAEGQQGAVAVLLYHGLSGSDSSEVMPGSQLRAHIQALKAAQFRFVAANELPKFLARAAQQNVAPDAPVERWACITFDDARRDSLRYGTPVGREFKLRFAMHIPIGLVEAHEPLVCTWDQLRDYQKAGCWVFGGHAWAAHYRTAIDSQQRIGFALPNHVWLPAAGRLETDAEYNQRLEQEYSGVQHIIARELGHGAECNFFAYPFGDIGQLTRSNDAEAQRKNLEACGRAYTLGFIQSPYGFAIAADNPLLYQRFEPDRADSGAAIVQQVLENQPVNLARRLRAEFCAQQRKRYLMQDNLNLLARDGYPAASMAKLRTALEHLLGRRLATPEPDDVLAGREAPLHSPASGANVTNGVTRGTTATPVPPPKTAPL